MVLKGTQFGVPVFPFETTSARPKTAASEKAHDVVDELGQDLGRLPHVSGFRLVVWTWGLDYRVHLWFRGWLSIGPLPGEGVQSPNNQSRLQLDWVQLWVMVPGVDSYN